MKLEPASSGNITAIPSVSPVGLRVDRSTTGVVERNNSFRESDSRSIVSHNYRLFRLGAVTDALRKLSSLPEDAELALRPDVATKASNLIAALVQSWNVPVPTLFPAEYEAVSFKWSAGSISRFLTISDDDIALMDLDPASQISCEYEFGPHDHLNLAGLLAEMQAFAVASTSLDDDGD